VPPPCGIDIIYADSNGGFLIELVYNNLPVDFLETMRKYMYYTIIVKCESSVTCDHKKEFTRNKCGHGKEWI